MLNLQNITTILVTIHSQLITIPRTSLDILDSVEKVELIRAITNYLKVQQYEGIVYDALLTYQDFVSQDGTTLQLTPPNVFGSAN